ncbi:MAG: UPF0280 family protein [Deltaproteobacteria bacterium]|nr:UPF0280 family protein [Deltaproteobacteria bacterium]
MNIKKDSIRFRERTYRQQIDHSDLCSFIVSVEETDLLILADCDLSAAAYDSVYRNRQYLTDIIKQNGTFLSSLAPLDFSKAFESMAPEVVRSMIRASRQAGVGPMAAVAGAVAECVGRDLLAHSDNVIVENGGDIFMKFAAADPLTVSIFAGDSPLSNKVHIKIRPEQTPLGICTSSGTVGHSKSYGHADAVCVIATKAALADAAATAIGNAIKDKSSIKRSLRDGAKIEGVRGIVIIVDDCLGAWGEVEFKK